MRGRIFLILFPAKHGILYFNVYKLTRVYGPQLLSSWIIPLWSNPFHHLLQALHLLVIFPARVEPICPRLQVHKESKQLKSQSSIITLRYFHSEGFDLGLTFMNWINFPFIFSSFTSITCASLLPQPLTKILNSGNMKYTMEYGKERFQGCLLHCMLTRFNSSHSVRRSSTLSLENSLLVSESLGLHIILWIGTSSLQLFCDFWNISSPQTTSQKLFTLLFLHLLLGGFHRSLNATCRACGMEVERSRRIFFHFFPFCLIVVSYFSVYLSRDCIDQTPVVNNVFCFHAV